MGASWRIRKCSVPMTALAMSLNVGNSPNIISHISAGRNGVFTLHRNLRKKTCFSCLNVKLKDKFVLYFSIRQVRMFWSIRCCAEGGRQYKKFTFDCSRHDIIIIMSTISFSKIINNEFFGIMTKGERELI